uniref:Tripartite motif-containing protein 16-like n=1 Tax=Cyprinodon variegatus TaxID=28743 RepID=A0A3Q2D380_CYPVA
MAQKGAELDRESFSCSICLDLLRDPVTILCGHSYCMKCIENFWDEEDEKGVHSCPQCSQTFKPRPTLVKNIMLEALTEQMKMIAIRKHQLVDPSFQFHENICSRHDEVMKMFCRTDQRSICYVCTVDEHKGHDIVSGEAERMEKQKKLEVNKTIFTEVIYLLQQRSFELSQQIRSQQDLEVSRVKDLQEKLEQEICELKKKDFELQHLSQTEDHNHFFLNFSSLSSLNQFQDTLRRKWADISLRVTEVDVLLSEPEPDPKKRSGFLKFTKKISLDPKTAHKQLLLDEGNRRITLMSQTSPDHPERFSVPFQILSRQSLTGRCYWEVKLGGLGGYVAVAYKEVYKADTEFGANDKSWALFSSLNKNIFLHNKIQTLIPGSKFSRIGVYVNQRAGTLSFYNVSENMTLLHRVQTTFTQPLYAGIRMYCKFGDTAEICKLK